MLSDRERHELDMYITGHYGEDQFARDLHDEDIADPSEDDGGYSREDAVFGK